MDTLSRRDASSDLDTERTFAVLAGLPPSLVVTTEDGPAPLDWLAVGDRVLTRDAGFQPVRLIERTRMTMKDLVDVPDFAPVLLPADCVSPGGPAQDLLVSPHQLCLIGKPDGEALVPARALGQQIDPKARRLFLRINYVSILFDEHHLLELAGMFFGSLFTADLNVGLARCPIGTEQPMRPAAPIQQEVDEMVMPSRSA